MTRLRFNPDHDQAGDYDDDDNHHPTLMRINPYIKGLPDHAVAYAAYIYT